jgi:hypothetical protein
MNKQCEIAKLVLVELVFEFSPPNAGASGAVTHRITSLNPAGHKGEKNSSSERWMN